MHRPVSPKPVEALDAHLRGSGVSTSARARSRERPVWGSDCSQKKRNERWERSSRKSSSDLVSRRPTAAAERASGIAAANDRRVSMGPALILGHPGWEFRLLKIYIRPPLPSLTPNQFQTPFPYRATDVLVG